MILDTSALVAILLNEKARPKLLEQIQQAPRLILSAVSLYEAGVVVSSKLGTEAVHAMYNLLNEFDVAVVPFDRTDAVASIEAYRQFGKGIHPIGLNFADCPVYALAQLHQMPVLATSDEFSRASRSCSRS